MRWLKIILGGLLVVIVAIGIVGWLLPGQYAIERSLVIAAPPQKIYPLVAAPKMWSQWSIWTRRDPAMQITYFGPESGTGAGWRWASRTEGRGEMTFTRADPEHGFTYRLYFPDFDSTSIGDFTMTRVEGGTRVDWTNQGNVGANPLRHYMAAAMDRLVGPDFEAGLLNLKQLAEKP